MCQETIDKGYAVSVLNYRGDKTRGSDYDIVERFASTSCGTSTLPGKPMSAQLQLVALSLFYDEPSGNGNAVKGTLNNAFFYV